MNFKSLVIVGLSIATLGLSLPAHADTATVITNDQDALVTGDGNVTTQTNRTNVSNRERGSRRGSSTGNIVNNRQAADVAGEDNLTVQDNKTTVRNDSDTTRRRYRY